MNQRINQYAGTQQASIKSAEPSLLLQRALQLKFLVAVVGIVLIGRLFYLQVIRHNHYQALAIAEHQKKFAVPAERGTLYFRDGNSITPAVLNESVYTLYADPKLVQKPELVSEIIASQLKLPISDVKKQVTKKRTSYSIIAKRLSKDTLDKLLKSKDKLFGIGYTPVQQRVYPEGSLGAQTLGFVNDEGVGQYGVEGYLNTSLQGKPGTLSAITDVNGVPLSVAEASEVAEAPVEGTDMVLTIDRNIQAKAEEELASGLKKFGATKGSVVVLDPNSGAIKAMANVPTYNPGEYYKVGTDAYEKFTNRVVSDAYEPGSVMKPLVIGAGIDTGVINRNSTYTNRGFIQVADARISDAVQLHGSRSMTETLKYSFNTGVVWVLSQMGGGSINLQARQKLYDYYVNHYGFTQLTGIEQVGEVKGLVYSPKSGEGNNVRFANTVFGQGLQVSMIQVAAAFAAATNDGKYYKPHIIEGKLDSNGAIHTVKPKVVRQALKPQVAKQIREMTNIALRESGAVVATMVRPNYDVGGKSGTAQIIDPKTGKYSFSNAVGTYIGYGGDEKPKYVIMVRVDDAKLGSADYAGGTVAAPIFANISNWLIDYYNIKPIN